MRGQVYSFQCGQRVHQWPTAPLSLGSAVNAMMTNSIVVRPTSIPYFREHAAACWLRARSGQHAIHADPQSHFDDGLPHIERVSDRPANQSKSNKAVHFADALVETGMETREPSAATELAPGGSLALKWRPTWTG